jgi:hypothetical protein
MLTHRFLSLVTLIALLQLLASLAVPLAQAGATLPPQTFADGWQLLNAPTPLNRTDTVPGFFSITLKTLPIDPDLASRGVHPLALVLNRYTQLTFTPNPKVVTGLTQVTINGQANTANIVEQLAPEVHARYRKEVGLWQRLKNGATTVLHSVAIIPLSLLCLPLTPMFIGNVIEGSKSRKQTIADKKQDMALAAIWHNSQAFVDRVEALQQTFTPSDEPIHKPIPLLPAVEQLAFNMKRKQVAYLADKAPSVAMHLTFKQPVAKQTLQQALQEGSLPVDRPDDLDVSIQATYLLEPQSPKAEGVFIKQCQLTYRDYATYAHLWCEGYKQTKTP